MMRAQKYQPSGQAPTSPTDKEGIRAAAWDRIITGHEPPVRGGIYQSVMKEVASIAKENGMDTQQLNFGVG